MPLLFFMVLTVPTGEAAGDINLVIDGQNIESPLPPMIVNGRTLVPIRLVTETMGADVGWDGDTRTVTVTKGNRSVKLWIDNKLVDYSGKGLNYGVSDVAPQIFGEGTTFVPIRLVSNALGVSVGWDDATRTVYIDSDVPADFTPFYDATISAIKSGQVIKGTTGLKINSANGFPAEAKEVRFMLLDPITGMGPVVARGNDPTGTYNWMPDPFYSGSRILAAGIYDGQGNFLAGDAVSVQVVLEPQVYLKGVPQGGVLRQAASLETDLNFVAEYVKYEITNLDTGQTTVSGESDPLGPYQWDPQLSENGSYSIRVFASDCFGKTHYSPSVAFRVDMEKKFEIRGVSQGATVDRPVTLWLSTNFPINTTEYFLRDPQSKREFKLAGFEGYSSYWWFPPPEQAGNWELAAKVKDDAGNGYTSDPIKIQVPREAKLLMETIGPEQVLTGEVKLKSSANLPLDRIEYSLIDPKTGASRVIATGNDGRAEYAWTPSEGDSGPRKIQAVGFTAQGDKIQSEAIPVKIYLGTIHSSKPVIEKDKFMGFASGLAVRSQQQTGMSAALQTAQAILETGWGQYVPVDKYTGKFSNNLFGIKGSGSAGSVTSNTWEEYNGVVYYIDDNFRAYKDPGESWNDHKDLLLTGSRYEPFREVMHNNVLGAWALKRAGYATDSQYPLKLIEIIKCYDLHLLDGVRL
ncbi:MAG TPA: stalk domain-containing protein [Clostridia bacterium]|nr:stalk domain-containing protein [Clostridia bacterium]